MKKTTIVIVEDHKLIRQMWAKLFSDRNDIEITGESGKLNDAVELIKIKGLISYYWILTCPAVRGWMQFRKYVNIRPAPGSLLFPCIINLSMQKK